MRQIGLIRPEFRQLPRQPQGVGKGLANVRTAQLQLRVGSGEETQPAERGIRGRGLRGQLGASDLEDKANVTVRLALPRP